jgi:hypothetical protein
LAVIRKQALLQSSRTMKQAFADHPAAGVDHKPFAGNLVNSGTESFLSKILRAQFEVCILLR